MAETVLVVDDEESIRDILTTWLKDQGYNTLSSPNGANALRKLFQNRPDLVIADILMPEMDGYELCRLATEVSEASFMFLSTLSKDQDKVKGFEMGADDYVVKPVGMDEFLARVGALLRRRTASVETSSTHSGYSDSVLNIDLDRHEVRVLGELVELTPTEFKLLRLLTDHAGKSCRLRDILIDIWESPAYPTEVIKWHIKHLRTKIERSPDYRQLVRTVRGVGYIYEPPVPQSKRQGVGQDYRHDV